MNFGDAEVLELNELCNALVDGIITAVDRARLEQLLVASHEARRFYVRATALSASLFDYAAEMQVEAPDAIVAPPTNERPARALWWMAGSLAAVAMLVAAFWIGRAINPNGNDIVAAGAAGDDSIARISGAMNCRWDGVSFSSGDELRRGQRIDLTGGFAEITFDCGAQILLEGPASLELTSAWDAVLRHGTLKANVPPEAVGFRVSNPSVEVVDLGTEFSMVADGKGATEVFVIKGAVEAKARGTEIGEVQSVILREMQARRFGDRTVTEVRDREQKLRRLSRKIVLQPFTRPAGYVHWSFDEADGEIAAAEVIGMADDGFSARIEEALEPFADPRMNGRWQQALHFDGRLFAKADLRAMKPFDSGTIAFWINIPADAPLSDAGPMLTLAPRDNPARRLTVAWNGQPSHGPLGALRTNLARGFNVGTTPLRDGQWHHIAIVLMPASRGAARIQIKQYVDGRLEGIAARRLVRRRGNEIFSAGNALWIGASPGEQSRFHGAIDELFIADRALAPQEIKQLIEHNKPASVSVIAAE